MATKEHHFDGYYCYTPMLMSTTSVFDDAGPACESIGGWLAAIPDRNTAQAVITMLVLPSTTFLVFLLHFTCISCLKIDSPLIDAWVNLRQRENAGSVGAGWFWHMPDGREVPADGAPWATGQPNDETYNSLNTQERNKANRGGWWRGTSDGFNDFNARAFYMRILCMFLINGLLFYFAISLVLLANLAQFWLNFKNPLQLPK